MEIQGTQNNQNSLEKEEQSWRTCASQLQNLLKSTSNQASAVPGEELTY